MKDTSIEERQQYINELKSQGKFEQFQEQLLLWLERHDDMKKPEFLARITNALIMKRIDELTYKKLATDLDRIKMYNITPLVNFYASHEKKNKYQFDFDELHDLANCGLIGVQFRKKESLQFPPDPRLKMSRTPEQEYRDGIAINTMEGMRKRFEDRFDGYIPNNLGKTFVEIALEENIKEA